MKRIFIFPVVFLGIIYMTIPFTFPGQEGAYNPISKMIVCKNETACLHEVGHKIDQKSGWPSHSYEFYQALYQYLRSEMKKEAPSSLSDYLLKRTIMNKPWFEIFVNDSEEAYAIIFSDSKGQYENMVPIFREFYNWDLAAQCIEKYVE